MSKALGLVETRGLVAAIEAADAMLKAANVKLIGKERTDPALITIKITGETAAVKASVDAGAAAAKRVGVLVSTHIIPQPDDQVSSVLPELNEKKKSLHEKPSLKRTSPKTGTPTKTEEQKIITETEKKASVEEKKKNITEEVLSDRKENLFSESDTISRLRKEALGIKEEKSAVKNKSSRMNMAEIEILNVHQLRRLARSTEGFPIQGREISRANRNELLDLFKKIS